MSASIGIDVGGTFTDVVVLAADGSVTAGKVLSTPADQGEGVERGVQRYAPPAATVGRIVHGTTVVTNLLLERRGARLVLCATRGAHDLLELRRQERASLYDLSQQHPPTLVPAALVVPVDERVAPEGVHVALTAEAAADAAERAAGCNPDVVAVSLLHAYAFPAHERQVAAALAARLPGVDVVCSSDVLPEIREYERTATTCVEGYARPRVATYLAGLTGRLAALGLPAPGVVSSSGGTSTAEEASHHAASLALSGPAGGVAGAAFVARAAGCDRALSIDIGGTSADVGLILGGHPLVEAGGQVAGLPIALPRVLVETVSAGGGSIAWMDDGGALRVGPRSAGAVPGPVAFARGGTEPTVTDAHIAIGNIAARGMSDAVRLDVAAARTAVARLAERLGSSVERTALAIVATADAAMARALRRVSIERGIDPRSCVLVAFGGAGPLHACGLAEALGMDRVLIPPFAGVLSALGLAVAPARRSQGVSVLQVTDALDAPAINVLCTGLVNTVGGPGAEDTAFVARMRFRGQGHETEIPLQPSDTGAILLQRFTEAHQRRFGFTLPVAAEVISARVTTSGAAPRAILGRTGRPTWDEAASIDDGSTLECEVSGRRVIALPDATLLVANGWSARALAIGGWLLSRGGQVQR